jgi:energy-coupling factor transporter ATP-binding protein EcfA2
MDPSTIPFFKKRDYLSGFSEDEFRDQLVRPLFQRKGFVHGAELCGPTEAGKDCFFRIPAPFGLDHLAVVQTKIGNLNMGSKPTKSVEEAATQLRTAMNSKLDDLKAKQKRKPNFGFLCVSGQLSIQAKGHILETVPNPNITFLDVDDLVPEIDKFYKEFWHGISADKFPYLRRLETKLLTESEFASLTALIKAADLKSPVSDKGFVPLKLARTFLRPKKVAGKISQEPEFEETNLEELITRAERRFLIVGEAGSGKTTLLKRLAEVLCQRGLQGRDALTPVLIKAIDIAQTSNTLADFVLSSTESLTLSGSAAFAIADIENGQVCLLIDGIDELGAQSTLNAFLEKLAAFDATYPAGKVIIAGRNYSYVTQAPDLARYTRFNVSPIGLKEATQIIKNLGKTKLLQTDKSKEVMRQLESIHGFDLNPLVVTVFAASADSSRKDIPSNITELFSKFTELMLGRWDSEKGLAQQYESNLKSLLLQKIAFRMHEQKKVRIPSEEFKVLIETELAELGIRETKIDILLDEILNRSSLLRDVDGQTEFRHLLIQEFFAGRGIADEAIVAKYAADEWWRRAIVFYFGANPSNEAGLRALCRDDLTHTPEGLFSLGVTLGLASQACYFVKVREKTEFILWAIRALASAASSILEHGEEFRHPIHSFLFAYLTGRDAVGAECTIEIANATPNLAARGDGTAELEEFWLIVGLMESGHLNSAFERIKKFKPTHALPLLALDMGAFFIEKVRTSSREHKRLAKEIGSRLQPSVVPLAHKYLKEFKSRLIEVQRGEVRELPLEPEQPTLM